MPIIVDNLDVLKDRLAALQKEAEILSKTIEFLETHGKPVIDPTYMQQTHFTVPIKTAKTATAALLAEKSKRTYSQGLSRDILLNLYTGKTTVEELARVFKAQHWQITSTLGYLVDQKLAKLEDDQYTLTVMGHARAKWFQEHPQYKVYRPK